MFERIQGVGLVLALNLLTATAARAQILQDATPVRDPANPLLTRGPPGSYDELKIGPRAILREGPTTWKMWYEAAPSGNKSYTAYATST